MFNESVMLGLRRCCGVDFGLLKAEFPEFYKEIERQLSVFVESGKLVPVGSGKKQYAIAKEYLFVADGIIRELFV